MGDMIDVNVAPYRVEYRPDLTTPWVLVGTRGSRPLADDLARETLELYHRGYCRLIVQHVIAASERPGQWESAT